MLRELVERGQRAGTFRTDLPAEWLVSTFYAVLHAGADHARSHRMKRSDALELISTTIRDLFAGRELPRTRS